MKKLRLGMFLLLALMLVLTPILGGCAKDEAPAPAPAPSPTPAKTYELKYAGMFPEGQMLERMPAYWAEEVEKRTNGRVKATCYHGQALGKFMDHPEMVRGGICDLAFVMAMSPGFGLLGAGELSFIIPTTAAAMDAAYSVYSKGLFSSIFEESGFKLLYFEPTDPFYFLFRDKKITSLNELQALKLRGATPPQMGVIEAMGASAISIPSPDLYMALDRGTIDGLITAPEYCLSAKLYEVVKYCAYEPIAVSTAAIIMNLDVWNSLPADIQVIIEKLNQEIRYDFMDMQHPAAWYGEEMARQGIEVYHVSPEEVALWRTTLEPIELAWIADKEAKGQPAQEIVDLIKETVSRYEK